MNAYEVANLSRDYGRVRALDAMDLQIEPERVVALLGPNGAGKTTLLHILTGLLEPTEGEARVLGENSRALPANAAAALGYMGDADEPGRWATVRELLGVQAGVSRRFDKAVAKEFLGRRGLSAGSRYGSLSKGQKKWVRAALVLGQRPQVLLLDEPAEGLDPSARRELYDDLRDYVTEYGATALVATHIIGDIERIADEVAVVEKGRLLLHGALEDLREQVHEIQLPADEKVPLPGQTLGAKTIGETRLTWVRCEGAEVEDLRKMLGERGQMRSVNLETLYLAVTEHRADKVNGGGKEMRK